MNQQQAAKTVNLLLDIKKEKWTKQWESNNIE